MAYLAQHANSTLGLLIQSADTLSFSLAQGIVITAQDISILEYKVLRILVEEREKFAEEVQAEQQMQQARQIGHSRGVVSRAKPISHLDTG